MKPGILKRQLGIYAIPALNVPIFVASKNNVLSINKWRHPLILHICA